MRWDVRVTAHLYLSASFLSVCVMAAPDYLHLTDALRAIFFWGGLGGAIFFAISGFRAAIREERTAPKLGHHRRMIAIYGMMVCGVGLLGFATLYFWPISKSSHEDQVLTDIPSSTSSRPVVLHAKCGQPDISPFVRAETERFIFPFSPLENGRITHGLLELDKDATLTPAPEKTPLVVMQCAITNYGAVPILNARLTLGIEFRKAMPQGDHGLIGGELVQHVDWPIDVAKIDVGENKPFIFYLWNISPHFAMVRIYDNVSFQRVDENEDRIAKLVQPQTNPNFPLLFPPTRDTTNKPN